MPAKKKKKLKTGSPEWIRALKTAVINACPPLIECCDCGSPTEKGFVCPCGSENPDRKNIPVNPEEWLGTWTHS